MKLPDITLVEAYLKNINASSSTVKDVYDAIAYVTEAAKQCKCTTCKCDKKLSENVETDNSVKITSLSDRPNIKSEITESENEIFVKSVDVIKDACGTGKIEILGREVLMNVCESDNIVHANFDIEVDGKTYSQVPFVVRLTEGEQYVKLNKNKL